MHSLATVPAPLPGGLAAAFPSAVVPQRHAAPLTALRILANALFIMALLTLNMGGAVGAGIFFAILAVMVFISPEAAFKSLAICFLGLMTNSFFVPKSLVWTPLRVVLPMLALLRFSLDLAASRLSLFSRASYVGLVIFCGVMAVCSVISGWYTHIALLKIAFFLAYMTCVFAGVLVLRNRRADLSEWIVSLSLAAALFGIAAIAFGQQTNFRILRLDVYETVFGSAFNGAFLHPNVHSSYASSFVTFLGTVFLLSRYRQRWLVLPLMACWTLFIVWSAARTAFLSCAVAALLLAVYAKPLRNRFGSMLQPNLSRRTIFGLAVTAALLALLWNAATDNSLGRSLAGYIVKGEIKEYDYDTQISVERIVSSRKGLIQYSWESFLQHPVTGIGFGVAKTEAFEKTATYLTAPVEKGFLPTAILEEGGVLGATAFVLFLGLLSWELLRERNVAGFVMLWTYITSNLGEVTIIAPGGAGAFGWLMVGAAILLGDRCLTAPTGRTAASPGGRAWRP